LDISHLNSGGEAVLPNVFQNDSSSIRKAASPEEPEPEPEPFLEQEPCETDPKPNYLILSCTV
jgi:hypothetical protein